MQDNQLIQLFLPIINQGLINDGFTQVAVKQANQPTMQGINTGPTIYFYKIGDKRYGFLGRYDKWDINTSQMIHKEIQVYETTFQVSALVLQDPLTPNQYTSSDLVNEAAAIMQSDYARAIMIKQNVGILRVTDVSNPYFFDDHDQFEASPSFEFTLTHLQTRVSIDPVIDLYDVRVNRV